MSFFEKFIGDKIQRVEKEVLLDSFKQPFKLRPLTSKELNKIARKHTKGGEADNVSIATDMIVSSVVFPDFSRTEVIEAAEQVYEIRTGTKTNITNASDALTSILLPHEFDKLAKVVKELSEETKKVEEEDKNFRKETD